MKFLHFVCSKNLYIDASVSSKGVRRSRISRELESLYIDEGAVNILEEMKVKQLGGNSKRRASMAFKGVNFGNSAERSPSPQRRSDRKQDSESEKKKRKITETKSEKQDKALENWQAVPVTSSTYKVYELVDTHLFVTVRVQETKRRLSTLHVR